MIHIKMFYLRKLEIIRSNCSQRFVGQIKILASNLIIVIDVDMTV